MLDNLWMGRIELGDFLFSGDSTGLEYSGMSCRILDTLSISLGDEARGCLTDGFGG